MSGDIKRHVFYIIVSTIVLLQFFLLLFNGDSYIGANNISHFQTARYSFKHPELFLNLGGNPVYSTFLAPFALLGYNAAKVYNLIIAMLTLALTAKLSDKIFNGSSNYVIILSAFAPAYFFLMITCLPAVLFSLFAVVAVYLFCVNKFYYSAIVLSVVPFILPQGIILLPFFALAFLLKQNYWPILFLCLGTVFFALSGFFAFGDWLWILHKFPSSTIRSVSGIGSPLYFIKNSNFIFGVPFLVLIMLGLVYWLFQIIRNFSLKDENLGYFFIISGSWLAFCAVNNFLCWNGGGPTDIDWIFGAVVPLAALTSVKGIQFISEKVNNKRIVTGIISLITLAQIFTLFLGRPLPTKASPVNELVKKSTEYIKQADFSGKVYYFDPEIAFQLGIDPYDESKCSTEIKDTIQPSNSMEWGDILVWDSRSEQNDGGIKLANLEKDPCLNKMESFYLSEEKSKTEKDNFCVQIFKKSTNKNDSVILSDSYTQVLSFENYSDSRAIEVDGFKVWKLDSSQEYSPTIVLSPTVVKQYETLEIEVTLDYKTFQAINKNQISLVFSAENDGKSFRYESAELVSSGSDWKQAHLNIKMPANNPSSPKLLIYVWNMARKQLLIKKMTVNVKSN